jgi:hypothetical protein
MKRLGKLKYDPAFGPPEELPKPKIALSADQRVLYRSLLAVLPEQVIKCLDRQCIQGGIFFNGQRPEGSPAIQIHSGQDLFEGIRVLTGSRSGRLWLASHLVPLVVAQIRED